MRRTSIGSTNGANGYFHIAADGEVHVGLKGKSNESSISLKHIAIGLQERGLKLPVLLRFSDILDDRIKYINENFAQAIADSGYRGVYRGVYPVKVNQQQQADRRDLSFRYPVPPWLGNRQQGRTHRRPRLCETIPKPTSSAMATRMRNISISPCGGCNWVFVRYWSSKCREKPL